MPLLSNNMPLLSNNMPLLSNKRALLSNKASLLCRQQDTINTGLMADDGRDEPFFAYLLPFLCKTVTIIASKGLTE